MKHPKKNVNHPPHPETTASKLGFTSTHRATANERKTVVDREKYRVERRNCQYLGYHLPLTKRDIGCKLRFRRLMKYGKLKVFCGVLESLSRRSIVPCNGSDAWIATICSIRVGVVLDGVMIDEVF